MIDIIIIIIIIIINMSISPSIRVEHLSSHWTDFSITLYLVLASKSVDKIRVQLKSDKKYMLYLT